MPLPLIIAGGIGTARAIGGIVGAGKKARRDRDLIKRAYKVAQGNQEREQGFTRQNTNEELNARGILNAGSGGGMPKSGAIADAYRGTPKSTKKGIMGILEDASHATENYNQRRMAVSSTKGETGQANTLSGSVNRDLSNQFLAEQEDLWHARERGINETKAEQAQGTVNAIGNGISTGMSVYNGLGALGAMRGAGAAAAPSPAGGGVTIRGAMGIDPVNPLGIGTTYKLGVGSGFNFNTQNQESQ